MINRRNILQSLVGFCFLPFCSNKDTSKQHKDIPRGIWYATKPVIVTPKLEIFETIGEIQSINFSSEHNRSDLFYIYSPHNFRPINFPIETTMIITGKYGELTYTAYNVKIADCIELYKNPQLLINNMEEIFTHNDLEAPFTSIIKYKGVEFRLASLSLNIYNEETKDFTK